MADTFRYVRSTSIAAEPARVASFIHDFHAWARWSPWEKLDADLQRSYSGAEKGVGARYAWAGRDPAGKALIVVAAGHTPALDRCFSNVQALGTVTRAASHKGDARLYTGVPRAPGCDTD